jgi:ComF family protein
MMTFKNIYNALLDVLFPRICPVCDSVLASHEQHICTKCLTDIPITRYHTDKFNAMEQLFAGKVPIEHATGFFFYEKGNPYANIIHDLKYRNQPQLGRFVATLYAKQLVASGYFSDIDYIIPVPLHPRKKRKRGYNQSELIAQGFADVFNVPILTDIIVAVRDHDTQTAKGIYERWLNTQGIFDVINSEYLENKHILLVDDVVTTGATLLSAASTIAHIPGIKISLATLGVARLK